MILNLPYSSRTTQLLLFSFEHIIPMVVTHVNTMFDDPCHPSTKYTCILALHLIVPIPAKESVQSFKACQILSSLPFHNLVSYSQIQNLPKSSQICQYYICKPKTSIAHHIAYSMCRKNIVLIIRFSKMDFKIKQSVPVQPFWKLSFKYQIAWLGWVIRWKVSVVS